MAALVAHTDEELHLTGTGIKEKKLLNANFPAAHERYFPTMGILLPTPNAFGETRSTGGA